MNNKPIVLAEAVTPGSTVNVYRINPRNGKKFATHAKVLENRIADGLATGGGENVEFVVAVIADDATNGCEFYANFDQLEVLSIKG